MMIHPSPLKGIGAMVLAAGAFVTNDSLMKSAMADLPPFEVLFLRGCFGTAFCLPLLLFMGLGRHLPQTLDKHVVARALAEIIAVGLFVTALARMPIGDLTAIAQTTPLFVILAVAVIWRERIGLLRLTLIAAGFAGALMVANPGTAMASSLALLGLATAFFSAMRDLIGRSVPHRIPILIASFTTIVMVMLGALAAGLVAEDWKWPDPDHLLMTAGAGFLLIFGHIFIFMAYRLASAVTVAPFIYCFTVWAVISQLVVFGDMPGPLAFAGIVLIIVSGLAIATLDGRRRRLEAPVA
jgi:drug/metabolite transporter (DMT)-like permease